MSRRALHFVSGITCAALLGAASPAMAQTKPSLGTAQSYAVIGGSTVTNTGATTVNGDLGVSPGNAVTGFPPGTVVSGTTNAGNAGALQAQNDVTTAYNNLAGQGCTQNLTGQDLGGKTLTTGVYCFDTSAQLTGTLTLDGGGNANAVFIFKTGSTITTASNSRVVLTNSAQSCNVFWQIGSSATLGTSTSFVGNILALTAITMNTSAISNGRLFARNAAVTLDTNTVTASVCASTTTTPTPGTPGTPGTGTTPSPSLCIPGAVTPTISSLRDQSVRLSDSTIIDFTISGNVIPSALTVTATSSDQGVLPASALIVGPATLSGARTLTVIGERVGSTMITVTVSDPSNCATVSTFRLTVLPLPVAVPTLPQVALMMFGGLLLAAGYFSLRRRTI